MAVPHAEVLTSREFAVRTMKYWMLETGLGITVVVTAVLGFSVSTVVVSQTLYTITQDNLPKYAMLSALGFAHWKLALAVLVQSVTLGMSGWAAGSALYDQAAAATAKTPIPLQTTPLVFAAITIAFLASCVIASFLSLKAAAHRFGKVGCLMRGSITVLSLSLGMALGVVGTRQFVVSEAPGNRAQRGVESEPAKEHAARTGRVEAIGYVEPLTEIRQLTFRTGGLIQLCSVKVGDHVAKCEILMSLDDGSQVAALEVAKEELRVAQADEARILRGVNTHRIEGAKAKAESVRKRIAPRRARCEWH